jgi:hypothetical protein
MDAGYGENSGFAGPKTGFLNSPHHDINDAGCGSLRDPECSHSEQGGRRPDMPEGRRVTYPAAFGWETPALGENSSVTSRAQAGPRWPGT